MKTINILKILVNFFYGGFLWSAAVIFYLTVFLPQGSISGFVELVSTEGIGNFGIESYTNRLLATFLNFLRIFMFFVILHQFRKVVMTFKVGDVYGEQARYHMRFTGFTTILYGLLKMGMKVFLSIFYGGTYTIFSMNFTGFGSTYFIIAIGMMFLFIAIVLDESATIKQENELTI